MGKHSPGPWRWVDDGEFLGHPKLVDIAGETVCDFGRDSWHERISGTPPEDEDAKLIVKAPEMAQMLRELEWSGGDVSGAGCPVCDDCHPNRKREHKPDCELAALLRELP